MSSARWPARCPPTAGTRRSSPARCPAATATPTASSPASTSPPSTSTRRRRAPTPFSPAPDAPPVAFDRAAQAPAPLAADPPFHPSYEDRPGAPDRVFAMLDDAQAEHQVAAWAAALRRARADRADVLHLHHLTPLHEAARRVAADVPVV